MDPPNVRLDASALAVDASGVLQANVLLLFQQLLPVTFVSQALLGFKIREFSRVYSSLVVIWLMIWQRLQAEGTMKTAVVEVVRGLPASFWPQPCKRLRVVKEGGTLSSNTGAYNQARQDLSLSVVEQCCDRVLEQLMAATRAAQPEQRPAFFLDGTSLRTPHRKEIAAKYPPTSNQHGVSHWPVIRMLVAHDLYTGLALRPEWGPMNGEQAVSEQGLLESAIHRLPSEALVVGDANFGVFSVAYAARQQGHPVVLRLTAVRARHLLGQEIRDGMDQRLVWKPSRDDRRNHPQLPADACVEGRLIVRQVQPSNGAEPFLLALWTTLPDEPEKIAETYGYRWNVEVDLRSLKSTLQLDELTCTTPEMVAKEIDLAMMSYNLVRAVMYQTAQKAGVKPRAFSFTYVQNVLNAFLPAIAAAHDENEVQRLTEKMRHCLDQCRLPKRHRKQAPSPRAVWPKPKSYPARHA
jgi:putative transposase